MAPGRGVQGQGWWITKFLALVGQSWAGLGGHLWLLLNILRRGQDLGLLIRSKSRGLSLPGYWCSLLWTSCGELKFGNLLSPYYSSHGI
jgi:hypothetical protein